MHLRSTLLACASAAILLLAQQSAAAAAAIAGPSTPENGANLLDANDLSSTVRHLIGVEIDKVKAEYAKTTHELMTIKAEHADAIKALIDKLEAAEKRHADELAKLHDDAGSPNHRDLADRQATAISPQVLRRRTSKAPKKGKKGKKGKAAKKHSSSCFSFHYKSTSSDPTPLILERGAPILTEAGLDDLGEGPLGVTANSLQISFVVSQLSPDIIEEGPLTGFPVLANTLALMVVMYNDGSTLHLTGFEDASFAPDIRSDQKWAISGGTGAMVNASGEGIGICVADPITFLVGCEYMGELCL